MNRGRLSGIGVSTVLVGLMLAACFQFAGGGEKATQKTGIFTTLLEESQQAQTPNVVPLSPEEQLGKNLFFDTTLSDPVGFACATCHAPETGFTGPNSRINNELGVMPGVVPGRFGHRRPQMVAYAAFSPTGPNYDPDLQEWIGGNFWDGRAPDLEAQAKMPFIDANEMNNRAIGPNPPHSGGYSSRVVQQVKNGKSFALFKQVFGAEVGEKSDADFYGLITDAIATYERSDEVNPFSSKYDASTYGVPASNKYQFSASEERGRQLFFGKAQCSACHSSATLEEVSSMTGGKEVFTMYCFSNIGVPANPDNPFYTETDSQSNPIGYNPSGASFLDYGLGSNPNSSPQGFTFFLESPGDFINFRGLFKAPSLRNVDKVPHAGFKKAYMHNGVFKTLDQVVHFYNKRNIAVNHKGVEVVFDLTEGPPPGYTRLFPPPEVIDNVQNFLGLSPAQAAAQVGSDEVNFQSNGQIGNLGLSARDEVDLVNFLRTLSDGYTK